jgi:NAD(P)-dependent dehydrogenase (short-subunit alcohol dehydrogenase family)
MAESGSPARRVAIVTGAGSGIGRESAIALARDGFACVLAGRRHALLEAVAAEIVAAGGQAVAHPCDVTDEAGVHELFASAVARYGRVDLLFNNAGVSAPSRRIEDVGLAEWSQVVATNLTGPFLCTREAFRVMQDQEPAGGRIVNNGSISAYVPRPRAVAYNATKHAVTGLTRSASLEGRRYGIACGQIDIGNAATSLTSDMAAGREQADGEVRPEPTIDPKDVARAVAYMASLPLEANVQFMTVMATAMPYVGRG